MNNETKIIETSSSHAEALKTLLTGFGEGDLDKVKAAITMLEGREHQELNETVCQMAQEFHGSIKSFKAGLSPESVGMHSTNIPDAARKLEYVLKATNEATMKLFGLVEKIEVILEAEREELKGLEVIENPPAEYISRQRARLENCREILSEMVVAQEYQDLCGQALSKVLKLVKDLESTVTGLMKQCGVDAVIEQRADTRYDQGDADALLKELGF